MKTNIEIIKPIPSGLTAFQVASECYKKWKGIISFEEDLNDYLATGIVIARPDLFGMAKIIELPETLEPAWFIRMAVGRLPELLSCLPGYLPKICFCRRNDGRMRIYSLERFWKLVIERRKYGRRIF